MSLRNALLAGAVVAGFATAPGAPVSAATVASTEAAYIEALQALARVQAERKAAMERLEQVRHDRSTQQADLDRRRDDATAEAKRIVTEKQAALDEFLRQAPLANAALEQANAEVAKARQAVVEAESRLKQDKAAVVDAQSMSSVLKVNIDRAKVRIDTSRGDIDRERARIQRIESGDPGELDELAKRAVQEKEEVAGILREFEPAFQAAQRTARIAVGMHLPALYKAKQTMAQIKTNFCGQYTESARDHIDYALQGIESFLSDVKGMAGVYLDMAMKREPKEADATCSHNLADTGIAEAKERIAEREQKITEDEGVVIVATAQLASASQTLANAKEQIAGAERNLQATIATVERLERDLAGQKAAWEAEAERARQERAQREQALRNKVAEATRAYEAAVAPFQAEAEALPSLKEPTDKVADGAQQLSAAETKADQTRDAFLDELTRVDVERLVRVSVQTYQGYNSKEVCGSLENNSPFAMREVTFTVTVNGRPLPEGIVFKPYFSTSYHEFGRNGLTEVSTDWNTGLVTFHRKNRYSERVPYLMPGARSQAMCTNVEELFKGNNLRILEKNDYDQGPLGRFGLRIATYSLADGSVSADSRAATHLGPMKAAEHYRTRLDQAKARAKPPVAAAS